VTSLDFKEEETMYHDDRKKKTRKKMTRKRRCGKRITGRRKR
jgi:hypothetical protein